MLDAFRNTIRDTSRCILVVRKRVALMATRHVELRKKRGLQTHYLSKMWGPQRARTEIPQAGILKEQPR